MVRFAAFIGALGCTLSCAEPAARRGASPPPLESATVKVVLAPSAAVPEPTVERWAEAIRAGDFPEAQRRLATLPPARATNAEVRFVRARVALELGDFAAARVLLEHLEQDVPLLTREITKARADVSLSAGPYEEAVRYYTLRGDADALAKAAVAQERAGKLPEARALLDRALRLLGSDDDATSTAIRVRARGARARIAAQLKDAATAETDLRWLAVEAPDTEAGRVAVASLAALSPPAHLTADQELARAKRLAEAARIDDALAAIDAAGAAGTREKPSAGALVRARGFAYYLSRANYAKAAELLEQSSKMEPKEAPRDSFFSARATARAGDDPRAIERYEALARRFPTTPFAEEAVYQAARLRFLLGQWEPAAHAYRAYLDAHPKKRPGRFSASVRYELSLALLGGKHAREAAALLEAQVAAEDDPLDRAALHELEGAAFAEAGDKVRAATELRAVIRERPLSFPALIGAARLAELGEPLPPLVERDTANAPAVPLVVDLPARAELLGRLGFVREAAQELSGREQELATKYAPRGYEALCLAYGKLGAGAERIRIGRSAVKSEALERAPTDATRWAWDCVYPTPFAEVVRAAETERGLPYGLLHAIMRQESAFKPDAVSPARAVGLLQLVPETAEKVAAELGRPMDATLLTSPSYNVELGAYYVYKVMGTFGGHVALAAAAYNAGPRAVSRWLEAGESLPLDFWVARIPYAETRSYVTRVVGNLARYSYLHGGEEAVPRLALSLPKGMRAGPDDY
jgi:soluble lytic murein transglycosylase